MHIPFSYWVWWPHVWNARESAGNSMQIAVCQCALRQRDCRQYSRFPFSVQNIITAPVPANVPRHIISRHDESDTAFHLLLKSEWPPFRFLSADNWKFPLHTNALPAPQPYSDNAPNGLFQTEFPDRTLGIGNCPHNPASCVLSWHPHWTSDIFWIPRVTHMGPPEIISGLGSET